MNRMRLKIASRLKEAQNTTAMLTTFNELDMSAIMQVQMAGLYRVPYSPLGPGPGPGGGGG